MVSVSTSGISDTGIITRLADLLFEEKGLMKKSGAYFGRSLIDHRCKTQLLHTSFVHRFRSASDIPDSANAYGLIHGIWVRPR